MNLRASLRNVQIVREQRLVSKSSLVSSFLNDAVKYPTR
ncbi:RPE3 domain protein [Rickettsia felis str. Pedreira]|uniref:RPE3 domain protein n=1 Tax=Rickettsia felis str. Pedreira TaxID=1359196 RepID=A0A0F3MUE7_RICFI|nr:palindromic element RPE3 domain-containing protein [Rickettsia felis]KJV59052.1 RPE3 domain protein [Rickettsia felis str. Pedreira]MDE8611787.1 palindromic element RPE3 domain-containing protein [Rickettsia felis]